MMLEKEIVIGLQMALGVGTVDTEVVTNVLGDHLRISMPGKRNFVQITKPMVEQINKDGVGSKNYWWLVNNLRELPKK